MSNIQLVNLSLFKYARNTKLQWITAAQQHTKLYSDL